MWCYINQSKKVSKLCADQRNVSIFNGIHTEKSTCVFFCIALGFNRHLCVFSISDRIIVKYENQRASPVIFFRSKAWYLKLNLNELINTPEIKWTLLWKSNVFPYKTQSKEVINAFGSNEQISSRKFEISPFRLPITLKIHSLLYANSDTSINFWNDRCLINKEKNLQFHAKKILNIAREAI